MQPHPHLPGIASVTALPVQESGILGGAQSPVDAAQQFLMCDSSVTFGFLRDHTQATADGLQLEGQAARHHDTAE